jgi:hypothetical protein
VASYNKIQDFVEQLCKGKHIIGTDVFKVMLSSATDAPTATDTVRADITSELSTANGYTSGGASATLTVAESGGTATATGTMITWTASGGSIGPFRYATLYNDTQTSPADALVAWWDYGSNLTLNDGESFNWKPNNSGTTGTVFTLA